VVEVAAETVVSAVQTEVLVVVEQTEVREELVILQL
jgi:hypothetical protein